MVAERWAVAWGVTDAEVRRAYPCDEVVPDAPVQLWRGVTVEAPPDAVWPWVRQLRLAPYSYDWVDNLGRRSPRELRPLEEPRPGDPFTTVAARVPTGRVVSVEPGVHLTAEIMGAVMSYVLVPDGADRTRLLLKLVMARRHWWTPALAVGDLVMARKQLRVLAGLAQSSSES
jgi:hypothetical protein